MAKLHLEGVGKTALRAWASPAGLQLSARAHPPAPDHLQAGLLALRRPVVPVLRGGHRQILERKTDRAAQG